MIINNSPQNVAIIGGGLMGVGIAQTFALAGHNVSIYEPFDKVRESIKSRMLDNINLIKGDTSIVDSITLSADLATVVSNAHYVTEAVPEKLELKRAIFKQLVELAPTEAVLASNTSVMPISNIAQGLPTAERIVGTHWWNPPHLVPLVEVVQAEHTSLATINKTMAILKHAGKAPAHVRKDTPGFVANRLQHALWREAIAMVAEGICDAATLDSCVKNSFGLRMPVLGPLENADLVGLDLTQDIHHTIIPELDVSRGPNPFLTEKVNAGHLGFKSGEGFRTWTEDEMQTLRQQLVAHLLKSQKS